MKFFRTRSSTPAAGASTPIDRRKLVLGAGVAGAAAVAVHALRPETAEVVAGAATAAAVEGTDGYQLTQHVLRYYETAKV